MGEGRRKKEHNHMKMLKSKPNTIPEYASERGGIC
jgi:hypothetical protein